MAEGWLPYPGTGIVVNAEVNVLAVLLLLAELSPAQAAEPVGASVSVAVAPDLLTRYDAIRVALVNDKLDGVTSGARELAAASPGDPSLAAAASALAAAPDLATARVTFGEISRLLVLRFSATTPTPKGVVYFCPMFQGYAWWIQPKSGIANPYMGQSMPECGEEKSLKAAAKAAATP